MRVDVWSHSGGGLRGQRAAIQRVVGGGGEIDDRRHMAEGGDEVEMAVALIGEAVQFHHHIAGFDVGHFA